MIFIVCYYFYVLANVCFPFTAADTTYQPLIYALMQNYHRGQLANIASTKSVKELDTRQRDDYEDEEEEEEEEDYYVEEPKYVYKPLIVVPFHLLRLLSRKLVTQYSSEEYEEEEEEAEEILEEIQEQSGSEFWQNALTLPFKLLQTYGIPALAQYYPAVAQLQQYAQFYENLTRSTDSKAAAELKEEVTELKENLRKGSQKSAINGPRRSSFDTFNEYFPYLVILVKLGSYFVPGLGQVKTALIGLEVVRISWKTASMYNNGDSWYDIFQGLGREALNAVMGKREELEPLTSPAAQISFIDVSSMDMDTFFMLVENSSYPPLTDEDEATLQKDIAMIVDAYFMNDDLTEDKRNQMIKTIEMVTKFIALHAIIPAFRNTSGIENP